MGELSGIETGGISTAVGAVLGVAGGLYAKKAHEDYADVLRSIDWDMPGAMGQAETLLKEMSSQGLPGMARRTGKVESALPTSINAAKKVVSSPSDLLGVLSNMNNQVSDSVANLEIADATAELENKGKYASFLGGQKANAEMLIQNLQNETTMSIGAEEMAGKTELVNSIMQGLGLGATMGGGLIQADAIKENSLSLKDYVMMGAGNPGE